LFGIQRTFRQLGFKKLTFDMKNLGRYFFRIRSFTPIPLIIILIIFARPSLFSFSIGFIILILGESLRFMAVGYAGSRTRSRSIGAARDLVTTGPYAYVRNPLYLGDFLLSLGVCVISGVYWMIPILLIGFTLQYLPIILAEEEYLRKECGEVYDEYFVSVPRFIPRIRPYSKPSQHDFSLNRAIKSEKRTLTSIVLVIILVIGSHWLRE